jgi:hypothetical protein
MGHRHHHAPRISGFRRHRGGSGNDRLSGGRHGDVFVFGTGFGDDRIVDFEDGVDRIDLTGTRRVVDVGADTMIYVGDGSIRLVGINRADISSADFIQAGVRRP